MSLHVAHLPDLHFGFSRLARRTKDGSQNQREADVQRANLLIADILCEERPDVAVAPGDFLDSTRISTPALLGAQEFCRRLREAGIPLLIVGGNHDHVRSPIPPMLVLMRREGAHVCLEQDTLDLAGARWHLVPYRSIEEGRRPGSFLQEFDFSTEVPNILVAHASVEGYTFREDPVEMPSWWVEDERFALVCLGHIHHRQRLGETRAFYAGCSERAHFGERDETPGFYLHRLEGDRLETREVVLAEEAQRRGFALTPRPMLQWKVEAEGKSLEDLDAHVRRLLDGGVEGALGKLVISNASAALNRSRLRLDWQERFAQAGGFDLEIVTHTRRVGELLDVEFAAPPVNLAEAFAAFLGEQSFDSEQERKRLAELGREVLAAARERLDAAEDRA
jgi:DNA repair exonuclease SbcCD nuclease subunit